MLCRFVHSHVDVDGLRVSLGSGGNQARSEHLVACAADAPPAKSPTSVTGTHMTAANPAVTNRTGRMVPPVLFRCGRHHDSTFAPMQRDLNISWRPLSVINGRAHKEGKLHWSPLLRNLPRADQAALSTTAGPHRPQQSATRLVDLGSGILVRTGGLVPLRNRIEVVGCSEGVGRAAPGSPSDARPLFAMFHRFRPRDRRGGSRAALMAEARRGEAKESSEGVGVH